jgi:hypothetical protein
MYADIGVVEDIFDVISDIVFGFNFLSLPYRGRFRGG